MHGRAARYGIIRPVRTRTTRTSCATRVIHRRARWRCIIRYFRARGVPPHLGHRAGMRGAIKGKGKEGHKEAVVLPQPDSAALRCGCQSRLRSVSRAACADAGMGAFFVTRHLEHRLAHRV